jgi:hypothetical protein
MEEIHLLAGTVVHVYGIPVELTEHVTARTFTGNRALIEQGKRDHAKALDLLPAPPDGGKGPHP